MRSTSTLIATLATTALAIPLTTPPIHPSQRADVLALLAAANFAAPTNSSTSSFQTSKNCGLYILKGGWSFDLNADPGCSDIEAFEIMHRAYNDKCGLCVTFQ